MYGTRAVIPLPHAGRKKRGNRRLSRGTGRRPQAFPPGPEGRGTRSLPPAPSGTGAAGPSGLPAAVAPARPRCPAHLGPTAGSSPRCGGRRGELPQPQEQRLLRPSGLSRRGPWVPAREKRCGFCLPAQRILPRPAPCSPGRRLPRKHRGMEIPFPARRTRGPRQTVPGDSCGVCHRGRWEPPSGKTLREA